MGWCLQMKVKLPKIMERVGNVDSLSKIVGDKKEPLSPIGVYSKKEGHRRRAPSGFGGSSIIIPELLLIV